VDYFNELSCNFPGRTEENHEKSQSGLRSQTKELNPRPSVSLYQQWSNCRYEYIKRHIYTAHLTYSSSPSISGSFHFWQDRLTRGQDIFPRHSKLHTRSWQSWPTVFNEAPRSVGTYGGIIVVAHISNITLDGGAWLALRPGRFIPRAWPRYTLDGPLGGPQNRPGLCGKENNPDLPVIKPRTILPAAWSVCDWPISSVSVRQSHL
jgi:hypothetical protein